MANEETPFERSSVARSTVARKCREYYHRRLERTEVLQRRWSLCTADDTQNSSADDSSEVQDNKEVCSDSSDSPLFRKCSTGSFKSTELLSIPSGNDSGNASDSSESPPVDFRKCPTSSGSSTPPPRTCSRSSFDVAMDNLRKEITSLIAQDNDLFRQLLSLNDSIAELRVQQEQNMSLWNMDSDSEHESLESLSDTETTSTVSPASTLSSCCSSHHTDSAKNALWRTVISGESGKQRSRSSFSRTLPPSDGCMGRQRARSVICLRCHGKGTAPLYRRKACSSASLIFRPRASNDMDSYDSGIQIHSDSDHEIFV